VDVAADDNLTVAMPLSPPVDASGVASPKPASPAREPEGASGGGSTWRLVGWIGTGVLGAGAITFAVLADRESSTLDKLRSTYPTTSAALGHEASQTTTYALLADSLAAAAILVGGVTLFSTLSSGSADPRARGSAGGVQVGVGPGSARFALTF
jgi:hypothetical protein